MPHLGCKLLSCHAKHTCCQAKHPTSFHVTADLLTGADLNGDEDADSDLSHSDESADGDSMRDGSDALDDEEHQDEDAATDDIVTAKGNHKRREDKKLLPTEDKWVAPLPAFVCDLPLAPAALRVSGHTTISPVLLCMPLRCPHVWGHVYTGGRCPLLNTPECIIPSREGLHMHGAQPLIVLACNGALTKKQSLVTQKLLPASCASMSYANSPDEPLQGHSNCHTLPLWLSYKAVAPLCNFLFIARESLPVQACRRPAVDISECRTYRSSSKTSNCANCHCIPMIVVPASPSW